MQDTYVINETDDGTITVAMGFSYFNKVVDEYPHNGKRYSAYRGTVLPPELANRFHHAVVFKQNNTRYICTLRRMETYVIEREIEASSLIEARDKANAIMMNADCDEWGDVYETTDQIWGIEVKEEEDDRQSDEP